MSLNYILNEDNIMMCTTRRSLKESKLYTYMIGVEPNDWTINDTKACKKYGIECKGYYVLGDFEGMVLVGTLSDIENYVENYFGAGIAEDYLCPYDMFDFEDGEWITGSWYESKKSTKRSLNESKFKITDVKKAVHDALSIGESDIPWKYSDDKEFTYELENYLEQQAFDFEGSFHDNKYGIIHEYSDGLETIYLVIDSEKICTLILATPFYNF